MDGGMAHLVYLDGPAIWDQLKNPAWVAAWGEYVAILVTFTGLGFVLRQIHSLERQQKVAIDAVTSQLHGAVSDAINRVSNIFFQHPPLVRYFYEGAEAPTLDKDPYLRRRLEIVCEIAMDMVDSIVEQKRALPSPSHVSMDWSTWEAYFRYLYANSPVLRQFLDDNADFYPDYVLAAVGHVVVRNPKTGSVISTWRVCELDPDEEDKERRQSVGRAAKLLGRASLPRRGFPWLRTWSISKRGERDGDGAETVVVAAVEGVASDAVTVTLGVQGEPSARERQVLQYWILGTIDGAGVRTVTFDPSTARRTYTLRRRKARSGTGSFLIQEYRKAWISRMGEG